MYKFCVVVDVRVAVNNVFVVSMDMKQFVPFAVSWSYKIFRTAVNDVHLPGISCKVPDIFFPI